MIAVDPTSGAKLPPPVTLQVAPTITTTATPYSANDVIGGELVLSNVVRSAGGAGLLQSVQVVDAKNQKAALTILLFDSDPAGTYTDNAACPNILSAGDAPKLIRKINILTTDYETIGNIAVAEIAALQKVVKSAATQNLWAVVVTTGTPTFAANSTDLTIRFGFRPD